VVLLRKSSHMPFPGKNASKICFGQVWLVILMESSGIIEICFARDRHIKGVEVFDLVGKMVTVEAVDGISYSGKLVEIGEEEVHLEAEIGWIVIPVARVADIRRKDS